MFMLIVMFMVMLMAIRGIRCEVWQLWWVVLYAHGGEKHGFLLHWASEAQAYRAVLIS